MGQTDVQAAKDQQGKAQRRSTKALAQQQEQQVLAARVQAARALGQRTGMIEVPMNMERGGVQTAAVQALRASFEAREGQDPDNVYHNMFPADWRKLQPAALQAVLKRLLASVETHLSLFETDISAVAHASTTTSSSIKEDLEVSPAEMLVVLRLVKAQAELRALCSLVCEPTLLKALLQAGLADSMKSLWPLLLQQRMRVPGCPFPPEEHLEWLWRWRDLFMMALRHACVCIGSASERRRLLPRDLQLVKLMGGWCEAIEKQDCGSVQGALLATRALTQLLKLLELVTKEPLLPLMAASQQEAVCTLTRACLVVMEHNLAIYDRLVGQNVLCNDIVYCIGHDEGMAGGFLCRVKPAKQLFLERRGHLLLVTNLALVLDDPSRPPRECYAVLQLMDLLSGSWGARRLVEAGALPQLMRVLKAQPRTRQDVEHVFDNHECAGEVLNRLCMEGNSWVHDHVWAMGLLPATLQILQTLNPMLAAAQQLPPRFVGDPANAMFKATGFLLAAYPVAAEEATALKLHLAVLETYKRVCTLQARQGRPELGPWTSLLRHAGMVWSAAKEADANALVDAGILSVIIDSFDKVHFNVQQNLLGTWTNIVLTAEAKARPYLAETNAQVTQWLGILNRISTKGHPHEQAGKHASLATVQAVGLRGAAAPRIRPQFASVAVSGGDKDAEAELAAGRMNSIFVDPASAMERADGKSHCACCGVLASSLRALELQAAAKAAMAAAAAAADSNGSSGVGGKGGRGTASAPAAAGAAAAAAAAGGGGAPATAAAPAGAAAGAGVVGNGAVKLRKCSACVGNEEAAYYCGAACQRRDWQLRHKKVCTGRKK